MPWCDEVERVLARLPQEFHRRDLHRYLPMFIAHDDAGPDLLRALGREVDRLVDEGRLESLGEGRFRRPTLRRSKQPEDELDIEVGEIVTRATVAKILNLKSAAALRRGMFRPARGLYAGHLFLFHDDRAHPGEEWGRLGRVYFTGQGLKGDQALDHFNLDLAAHLEKGLQVHHFRTPTDAPGKVRYEGEVVVADVHRVERGGEKRSVLEYELVFAGRRAEESATAYGAVIAHVLRAGEKVHEDLSARTLSPFMRTLHERALSRLVRRAYGDACCVCGRSVIDDDGFIDLQAVPIQAIAEGGPYAVPNALSLCARHAWDLQHGRFVIDDQYRVDALQDDDSLPTGERLHLPDEEGWRPAVAYLRHHRHKWQRLAKRSAADDV